MIYVMVARADAALDAVLAAGGEIVRPVDPGAGEVFGWFRDPAGNVLGVYQQPGLAEAEASARPVPEHLHTVTPRLVVHDARAAVEFYRDAFGAEQRGALFADPGGTVVHAEIQLGDSVVYLTELGDNGGEAAAPAAGRGDRDHGGHGAGRGLALGAGGGGRVRGDPSAGRPVLRRAARAGCATRSGSSGCWAATSRTWTRPSWTAGCSPGRRTDRLSNIHLKPGPGSDSIAATMTSAHDERGGG